MLGCVLPMLYFWIPQQLMVAILLMGLCLLVALYFGRKRVTLVKVCFDATLGRLLRPGEDDMRSAFAMWVGLLLVCLVFPREIAIMAWFVLFVSDALAALVGQRYGSWKICGNKSAQGSLAFFFSAMMIGWLGQAFLGVPAETWGIIAGALVATSMELLGKTIDDNFTIQLGYATAIWLMG